MAMLVSVCCWRCERLGFDDGREALLVRVAERRVAPAVPETFLLLPLRAISHLLF